MDLISYILSYVPLHLVPTVLVSYLLWAQFRNAGKLTSPKTTENFYDFSVIFLAYGILIYSISFIFTIIIAVFSGEITWGEIFYSASLCAIMISCLIFILLTNYPRIKREEIFKKILYEFAIWTLGFFILTCGFLFPFILSPATVFFEIFTLLLMVYLFFSIYSIYLISKRFQSLFSIWQLMNKKNILFLLIVLFIGFILGIWTSQGINVGEEKTVSYYLKINYIHNDLINASEVIQKPLTINTLGLSSKLFKKPFVETIFIEYPPYLLADEKEFKLLLNISDEGIIEFIGAFSNIKSFNAQKNKNFSFKSVSQLSKNRLKLIVDENTILEEDVNQIILAGHKPINASSLDFSYSDNIFGNNAICNATNCVVKIDINNNLNLPVSISEDKLILLNHATSLINKSKCHLFNVSVYSSSDLGKLDTYCSGATCDLAIKKEKILLLETRFILDGDVLRRDSINMRIPMNISIRAELDCR